jgi:hypothetical protein
MIVSKKNKKSTKEFKNDICFASGRLLHTEIALDPPVIKRIIPGSAQDYVSNVL